MMCDLHSHCYLFYSGLFADLFPQMSPILGVSDDSFLSSYQSAIQSLASSTSTVNTKVFNGLYLAAGTTVRANYSQVLSTYYSSSVQTFSSPASGAQSINSAVATATNNLIPDLVSASALTNAVLVLVSALYFKGDWKTEFNASLTKQEQFLTSSGYRTVNMMKLNTEVLYRDMGSYDVISLPYKDSDYSMVILRPAAQTMASVQSLIDSLDSLDIGNISGQLTNRTVHVALPRFSISAEYGSLETALQSLGIQQLFTSADLGNMLHASLSVDKVIHKVKMEVTEQGTQAAGAGALISYGGPMPVWFTLDRPFVAVVWNKQHSINMFTAYVASP